jgi:hypothetical protein
MAAGDAAEWLLHAESDLTYAKLGQAERAILRNQVTFHAEQAAEKAFKAVLVHAAVEFPKTHDLQALLLLVRNNGRGSIYAKSQGPGNHSKPCAAGRQMRMFKESASAMLPGSSATGTYGLDHANACIELLAKLARGGLQPPRAD